MRMTGERLYREYVRLYAEWDIKKEHWDDLTETDRLVWKDLAAVMRRCA